MSVYRVCADIGRATGCTNYGRQVGIIFIGPENTMRVDRGHYLLLVIAEVQAAGRAYVR